MENEASRYNEWLRIFLDHIRKHGIQKHVEHHEGYKFKSVNHFQTHFDIESLDLAGNIDDSILSNNLVAGSMYFPKRMLMHYAEDFPDETRQILKHLFNNDADIAERINRTKTAFDTLESKRSEKNGEPPANTYISLRFISLLLGFMYPDQYNPLKPAEWKVFSRFINPEFKIPHKTPPGEQYKLYNDYIEGLRQIVKQRAEFNEIRESLTDGLEFKDSEFRWVTQDVIFVSARQYSHSKSEEITSEDTNDIQIEPDNIRLKSSLSDDDYTGFMPLEEHLEEYVVNNWANINFGEELSMYVDEDGNTGQQYTTDVGIIDILATDKNGDFIVIELKRNSSGYKVVGQILNYMSWVKDQLAEGKKVRGLIIVGKADKTLLSAIKPVSEIVQLKEYRVQLDLKNVTLEN